MPADRDLPTPFGPPKSAQVPSPSQTIGNAAAGSGSTAKPVSAGAAPAARTTRSLLNTSDMAPPTSAHDGSGDLSRRPAAPFVSDTDAADAEDRADLLSGLADTSATEFF